MLVGAGLGGGVERTLPMASLWDREVSTLSRDAQEGLALVEDVQ